jgi:rhamnogalacturonan endolyase
LIAALFALSFTRVGAVPAFPGAEGFGANASGGRGGTVYHVTNLNDSGAGSFRDAVSASGRTVVFDVGGIIVASSPIVVKSNITIAGQTAPGEGITIYGDRLSFTNANNTITRYLRFHEGINGDSGTDDVTVASGDTMMFDHISASWGRDETFSLSGTPSNITLQDCIIGEGLLIHSAGGLVQTSGGVSIFRCLYIDNWMRNPKVKGVNDFQNNVVYNWGSGGGYIPAGDSAGLTFANLIGNYFISGPNTGAEPPFKTGNANYSLYHAGNFQDLNLNGVLDGSAVTDASFPTLTLVPTPFNYPAPATLLTAQKAFAHVLANAGASLHRDHADSVMLGELASVGTLGAQIYNESEIGGVGTVAGGVAAKDTDGDGMPDWWEEAAGTNPLVADNNGDVNGDGYTNLENYLNAIAPAGVPAATIDGIADDTGLSPSDGITSDGMLVFRGTAAPGATVTLSRVDTGAIGSAVADGTGHWTFDYTATPLADRYYAFQATVDLGGGKISPPTRAFVVKVDTTPAATPTITSIVLTPSFTINGTSESGSLVNVTLVGTGVVATATTDAIGNWSAPYTGAPLAPGGYGFTAVATDLAGNVGAASAPYAIDTSIAAPVFTAIVSDTGASSSDQITNDTTLVFNGTGAAGATVTLTRAGVGVIGSTTAAADGTWSFNYTATILPAGVNTFTATAATGGNASPASPAFIVTVDTTRPTIVSIRRLNPATAATTGSTLVYRVTFAEPVSGVDATDFSLTLASGVTAAISSLSAVNSTTYDVTVTGAAGDGTVRLDLKSSGTGISDVAGNAISGGYTAGQTYTLRLPGSGVWISDTSGEAWSTAADWQDGIVANGVSATADFSAQNVDGPVLVQLDSPRTLGRVVFGDIDFTTPALWTLSNNGSTANVLTLATSVGSPALEVDAATSPSGDTVDVPAAAAFPSTLDVVLAGTSGFTKTGVGTLQIVQPATISGPLTITKGIVQVGPGGSLTPASVTIATSQQLRIAGGTFSTPGNVTWNSGTGTGIIVSDGTATFQKILPSNTRNSFFRVTGGTVTATEITFPRSGDSEVQALAAGIFISGGDTTVGTIGLGTADSWGSLAVSGGRLTVTGIVNNGFQATSTRGGIINNSGGEFNVTDTAFGLVMSRNPNTATPAGTNNPNNVSKLTITGGVSNLGRLTLGYSSTSSAGSAAVTLSGGELNLGAGGIVKNGTAGLVSTITLNTGTLGAYAPWSTTHPIVLTGTPASVALRAASATGVANDFALNGVLSGAGGFAKTGAGTVTLGAANTFAGDVAVNAGTLAVNGSIVVGGSFSVNAGGTLAGFGAINRAVLLDTGGTIAPGGLGAIGTLAGGALTWNGGGTLALDLGANGVSDQIALGGTLAKGSGGTCLVALNPGPGFAAGNTYTIATFASTTFAATDFTAVGLPAGYAGTFTLTANSLRLTLVGTPSITSAPTASGAYGAPFGYTITAANVPASFSATGLPAGLGIDAATGLITGSPAAVGTFNVTLGATNIAGTGTASLAITIGKTAAGITLGNLATTYDGTPHAASATTSPGGLNVILTYDGSNTPPTNAGSYAVVATVDSPFYVGGATDTLVVAQAAQTLTFPNPGNKSYGDPAFALTATATSGLPVAYSVVSGPATVSGGLVTITGVGAVVLRATQVGNANYLAAADVDVTFTVAKGTAAVTLGNLDQVYDGTPKAVTVTTSPAGLTVDITYNGSATPPTLPGTYPVVVTVDDVNYTGSATGVLTIGKAAAVVTLGDLNQTYDGTPKLASATTTPAGLTVVFSYDTVPSVITPPAGDLTAYAAGIGQTFYVNATGATTGNVYGSNTAGYAITSGVATAAVHAGVLTPGQTAVLQISILADAGTYTGSTQNGVTSQSASASGGSFQIVGIATSGYTLGPVTAGNYAVTATVVDANYAGTAADTLVIAQATPVITWSAPAAITYGTALDATQLDATASVAGTFVYTPAAGTILNAGPSQTLTVAFTPDDAVNFTAASASTMITVNQATATLTWSTPAAITYGTPLSATQLNATGSVAGTFVYTPAAGTILNAGPSQTLTVNFTPADAANYTTASASTTITVNKAAATVTLGNLSQIYNGSPRSATVTTNPAGLTTTLTYNGSVSAPVNVGTYAVVATVKNANYAGTASGTLTISKAAATVILGDLIQAYDGSPKSVAVTTSPAGLTVNVTYNGITTPPTVPGSYAVVATVNDPNYSGTASATLTITIAALVRHAPTLDGDIDGSLQVLLGESMTLNGDAGITGDLLVVGTPTVQLNGHPTFGGVHNGTGATTPSNYTVTLNGNALLRFLVRRTDPIAMPTVAAPPAPAGTRDVVLNNASPSAGNFSTLRDLTLNGNVGQVAVPPGTYRNFTANGGSGFTLGVVGATIPAIYNLQNLTVNGNAQIQVVGPVILTLANGVTLNGNVGTSLHPEWLTLRSATGGVTLNSNAALYGTVVAPNGTAIINGNSSVHGSVTADRLTINANGLLTEETP